MRADIWPYYSFRLLVFLIYIAHTVGKQDFIYEYSQAWRKKAQALGLDFIYTEGEGIHDFSYWNPRIDQEVLPFFFGS